MAIPVVPLTLVSSLERRLVTSVAEARSPFTGTSQIQDWGASWWEYQIEMAVTQGAKARRLSAFFTALGGLRGRFLFPDPSIEVPVAAGNPYVTEAQVAANHLLVKNVSVIGFWWGAYRTIAPAALNRSLATLFR